MAQISQITPACKDAYDDMFTASAIVESAITILDILGGHSLSDSDWSSATYGIGMILRAANDVLNGGLDNTVKEETA